MQLWNSAACTYSDVGSFLSGQSGAAWRASLSDQTRGAHRTLCAVQAGLALVPLEAGRPLGPLDARQTDPALPANRPPRTGRAGEAVSAWRNEGQVRPGH